MNIPIDVILQCLIGAALGLDVIFILERRKTISQLYQELFPTYMDMFIMMLFIALLVHVDLNSTTKVWLSVILGHVFWPNKERWR